MIIVLSGLAGVGKTALLHRLRAAGEHVVDLEALAVHRGSAFGAFGLGPQPTHAAFQRSVRDALARSAPRTWVEDEGEYLGSVGLPAELVAALRDAPCVEVIAPRAARVERIVATYAATPAIAWLAALDAVRTRLGAERSDAARAAVLAADLPAAVDLLLPYYDRGYTHRVAAHDRPLLAQVPADVPLPLLLMTVGGTLT